MCGQDFVPVYGVNGGCRGECWRWRKILGFLNIVPIVW